MTEVLKNQDTNDDNGWESLEKLNRENIGTTWEDVAKLGKIGSGNDIREDASSEEDHTPVIELSEKEQAKLGRDEYSLYINQPEVFARLQRIKQKTPKIHLTELAQQLARYYEPGHSLDAKRIVPTLKTLEDLADMYDKLQDDGFMLQVDILLERKPEETDDLRRLFDLVNAELFPRESEKTRQSLMTVILQKINSKRRKESTMMRIAEIEKKQFLAEIANSYHPENTKPKSTVELAIIYREAVDSNDEQLSRFIYANMNSREGTDDLLRVTKILQKMPENDNKQLQAQQKNTIKYFYETGGVRNFGEDYLTDVILPVFSNGILSRGQDVLLKTAIAQGKAPGRVDKMDYVLKQLIPDLMETGVERDDVDLTGKVLATAVEMAEDQSELIKMSELTKDELIPFVTTQRNNLNQRRYAEWLLHRHLERQAFQMVHRDDMEIARNKTSELIEKCNARVMPLLKESSDVIWRIERELADKAYEKDYEEKFTDYLRDDLFPKIHREDVELGGLLRNTNLRGEDRIAKYELNCVTTKINPRNLNNLIMERRELPTKNALKLEQNRVDALAIEGVIIPDHGFIHDEHPMMHDVILAMVEYYDSAKSKQAEEKKTALQETIKTMNDYGIGRYGNIGAKAFNLENYDKVIKGEVSDDRVTTRMYDAPAINVLRRLEENTRPDVIEKPMIDNADWQKRVDKVAENADWRNVGELVEYTNRWLVSKQNQYGLTPVKVEAIAYAERMATLAMRNITEKERTELPYDDVFKEFVRLQELIGGYEGYNEEKFEEFYSGFQHISMDADDKDLQEHFIKLQHRVLGRSRDLVKYYRKIDKPERGYMMQSNSLLHELVSLTEVRTPRTLRERADQMARGISYDRSEDLADETR